MNWLDINDSTEYNLRQIKKSANTVFPVGDGNLDNFLGVIYAKDLLNAAIDKKNIELSSFIKNSGTSFNRQRYSKAVWCITVFNGSFYSALIGNSYITQ